MGRRFKFNADDELDHHHQGRQDDRQGESPAKETKKQTQLQGEERTQEQGQ